MFDYNDYYKMYNAPIEAKYAEMKQQLAKFLEDMVLNKEKDKGFRGRMMQYSKTQGLYVKALTDLETKWQPEYYRSASLAQMKEDQERVYGDLMAGNYENSMVEPENCTRLSSKELGPILSMFAALFHNSASDAFMHRRFRLLKTIQLYFDMHRLLSQKQVRADQLMSLYRRYVLDNMQLRQELDFHHRIDPSDAFLDEMMAQEDLNDPYYLYVTGLPVSEDALLWHDFFNNEGAEKIDVLSKALSDGFINGLPENSRRSERWLVPILYSPGMEKVAVATGKELEKRGFVYFLRPEERGGFSEEYTADHRYDLAKVMGEEDLEAYMKTVSKTIHASESLVQGVAGRIELVEYRKDYQQEFSEDAASEKQNELHRKGRRFISETTRHFYREMRAGKERFLYEAGGMQAGSICSLMLPKIAKEGEEREEFLESFHVIIDTLQNNEQNNRALRTISNTLDHGDAIYLQGRGDNETDLVISLKLLEKPGEESNFQSSIGNTILPGGYVYTCPQAEETNGLLHFTMTVVNGVRYRNLKLTIEDGCVVDYSCDGFNDREEERQYLQENLLGGHDRLPFAETALGVNTALYCRYAENYSEQLPRISQLLPEQIKASICPSIVLGSSRMELEEESVINRATGKTVVCGNVIKPGDKKEQEDSDPEHSLITLDSLRIRIPMQFEDIGRISVIRDGNMVGDVIREGLFVPVGTDSLNKPLMKRMYKISE